MGTHYLDNSATTKPSSTSLKALTDAAEFYGNPSSTHALGVKSKRLLDESREKVKDALGIKRTGGSVIFTASGTEANCLALLGFAAAKNRVRGGAAPTIIIGEGEHPSIANPALRLEASGWNLVQIPTLNGEIDLDALRSAVRSAKNVALASFMLVNNETGALYDVKRAATIVKSAFPEAHVHCDAVQGFMKTKVTPSALAVDSLTVSAHKIHAPRGCAALWLSADTVKKKNITAILPGGGQEMAFRSGTENLLAIAAFAAACEEEKENFSSNIEKVSSLREHLEASLSKIPEINIKRPAAFVPHIINVTLPGIKSETMLNFLSAKEIYVSAGSACSASSGRLSRALKAFGCDDDVIDSSLRISLSHTNTTEDIDALCEALELGVNALVRFKP